MPTEVRQPPANSRTGAIVSFPASNELRGHGWEIVHREMRGMQGIKLTLESLQDETIRRVVDLRMVEKYAQLEREAPSEPADTAEVPVSVECLIAEARGLRLGRAA